jgi:hypothetical protein
LISGVLPMLSIKPARTFMTARSLAPRSLPVGTVAGP